MAGYGFCMPTTALRHKFASVWPLLDERARRLMAASEAMALAYGGVSRFKGPAAVEERDSGGIREIQGTVCWKPGRVRRGGAGRKRLTARDPRLLAALDRVEPGTRGDPESPLRWVCKSTRMLARELTRGAIRSATSRWLSSFTSSTTACRGRARPRKERASGPRRSVPAYQRHGEAGLKAGTPVISVDTKKKELVGNYANSGRQWRRTWTAARVNVHDFPGPRSRALIRTESTTWGATQDSSTSARTMTRRRSRRPPSEVGGEPRAAGYTRAAADRHHGRLGGSNGSRLRLWKWELQRFADESDLTLSVCHFPPGTSKWNKVEHRLFSFISSNWRGEPLRDYETIVKLIARTTTATGLKLVCRLTCQSTRPDAKCPTPIWKPRAGAQPVSRRLELRDQTPQRRGESIPLFINEP